MTTARRLLTRSVSALVAGVAALGLVGLTAAPAHAVPATVHDEATLAAALNDASVDVINFDPDFLGSTTIQLTAELPAITRDLVINGNGWTLDSDADGIGGGDYNGFVVIDHTVTFRNLTLSEMAANGIEIRGTGADVTIEDSRFVGNPAGVLMNCTTGALTITETDFDANTNGILAERLFERPCDAQVSVTGGRFRSNQAVSSGNVTGTWDFADIQVVSGALGVTGYLQNAAFTVTDSALLSDSVAVAMQALGEGSVRIERSTLGAGGDAVLLASGTDGDLSATLIDTEIQGATNGIGITGVVFSTSMRGDLTLIRTTIANTEHAITTYDKFAPSVLAGNVLIQDSTFAGNLGALVDVDYSSNLTIENSTFESGSERSINLTGTSPSANGIVENSTVSGHTGGYAINAEGQGQFALRHSTVTANTTDSAVRVADAVQATISHTIIAGNTGTNDLEVAGTATSAVDWSLLGTVAGTGYTEGDGVTTNVTDPQLAPLADNGGSTRTHLPLTGSPAIDVGNPAFATPPALDQRGLPRVSGTAIDIGSVEIVDTTTPVAPNVTNPTSVAVEAGELATFSVTATGTPTPVVTWEVSKTGTWEDIAADPAATVATDGLSVTIETDVAHSGYRYRATAANSVDTMTSNAATLTVNALPDPPTITDPTDVTTIAGMTGTFSVVTAGAEPMSVTWWVFIDDGASWRPIDTDPNAVVADDDRSVTITADDAHNGESYRAIARNAGGSATSAAAVLTVVPSGTTPEAPSVSNPADTTVVAGATATFTVTADGLPTPSVTWQVSTDGGGNWTPTGVSGSTLAFVATEALSGNQYRAIATNTIDPDAVSAPATLSVATAPTVSNPDNVAVTAGETATFTVTATGNPPPTVTWEVSTDGGDNWAPTGVSGLTLSIDTTEAHDGDQYRATATNSVDSDVSGPATLSVTSAPTVSNPATASVAAGETATFSVLATGSPAPTVTWEVSTDGGDNWAPTGTDGLTLSIVATEALNGNWYRATATNNVDSDVSAPAVLTVTPAATDPDPDPDPSGTPPLADTGSDLPIVAGLIAALALLLGGGLIAARAIVRRRHAHPRD